MAAAVSTAQITHPLRVRDFRLLWIGESVSLLGDQFYLIALPWLVLQITGSALALGTVLALASIPRALFMLIGGAFVDRFSPKRVMFLSNLIRMIMVGLLAALVLTNNIQLWLLYVLALVFGTADAFYFPAQNTMVPALLNKDQLEMGNTLVQGMSMLSMFLGPVLAGGVIAALAGSAAAADAAPNAEGIGIAFALDSLSFLASLGTLWLMGDHRAASADEQASMLDAIKEGLRFVWTSRALRAIFLLLIAINLFITGPFEVGVPVLAKQNLIEGAAAFGILMSAYGGGALLGIILAGVLPALKPAYFGTALLGVTALLGIGMILMPLSASTLVVALVSLLMGTAMGFVNIRFMTWLQKRVPTTLMGRVMSLIMFASTGIAPVSSTLAGIILNLDLQILFIGSGVLLTLTTLAFMMMRPIRQMGFEAETTTQKETIAELLRKTGELPALRSTGTMPAIRL